MDIISLAITAFVIYSLYTAFKEKSSGRSPGRPGRQNPPWMPAPPPMSKRERIEDKPRGIWLATDEPPLWVDPYKDKEVAEAEGQEGAWGDEGRPVVDASPSSEGIMGTEGTQGVEGTVGTEGDSTESSRTRKSNGVSMGKAVDRDTRDIREESGLSVSLAERDLIQGIVWAEVLGKPRALRRFRGPRV